MPLASIVVGTNEIFEHFKTAWDAQTPPIPQIVYQDSSVTEDPPTTELAFVHAFVQHNIMGQSTLSGEVGNKRFQRLGFFTVEIRTPAANDVAAATLSNREYGDILLTAFEGQNGGPNDEITFTNAVYNEIGKDGLWFQGVFSVEFEYTTIR